MTRYADKFIPRQPPGVDEKHKSEILAHLYKMKMEADCVHTYTLVNYPNSTMMGVISKLRYDVVECIQAVSKIETRE
jgi:hypothetical protein